MKKPLRVLAAVLIVLAGAGLVLGVFSAMLSDQNAAERDFISYWSAGRLLVHGHNPYDFAAVRKLEIASGRNPSEPLLMMRNPPVALPITLPLGFAGPKAALIGWLAFLMGLLALSVRLLGQLFGRPEAGIHLLGFAFAPALVCFMAGQFGIVMLFGLVIFLYLHRTSPFLAGLGLGLLALKPHYFLPFGIVLLLWSVRTRAWRIIAGAVSVVAAGSAAAYALDPHAWAQYAQMMRAGGALNEVLPDLAVQLRLIINPNAVWIQFVPEVAACLWAGWYFWTRRDLWSWTEQGLLVLLVGAVCTPYGWFFDETALLPAVLFGFYQAIDAKRPIWPILVFCVVALFEGISGVQVISRAYIWTTPAWLGWYLYATGRLSPRRVPVHA